MRKRETNRMGSRVPMLLALAGVLAAGTGQAQNAAFYAVTNAPGNYSPLGSAGKSVHKVTGTDLGAFDLNLGGWSFPYFGASYGDVWISADGFLSVHDVAN